MTVIAGIRADALNARKSKSPLAGLLVTVIGEAETKAKTFNPAREISDEETLAIVRKFLKNIDETLKVLMPEGAAEPSEQAMRALGEKAALEIYLPRQMTEAEIEAFVAPRIAAGEGMGALMSALKSAHAGAYDGRMASDIIKRLSG